MTVFTREVVLGADESPTRGLQLRADGQTLGDVAEGSSADRVRLLRDDRLLAIDGKDTKELDTAAVRLSTTGKKGSALGNKWRRRSAF